jgi:hypothetical protein
MLSVEAPDWAGLAERHRTNQEEKTQRGDHACHRPTPFPGFTHGHLILPQRGMKFLATRRRAGSPTTTSARPPFRLAFQNTCLQVQQGYSR